jgi:hypothetical protein
MARFARRALRLPDDGQIMHHDCYVWIWKSTSRMYFTRELYGMPLTTTPGHVLIIIGNNEVGCCCSG